MYVCKYLLKQPMVSLSERARLKSVENYSDIEMFRIFNIQLDI